MKTDKYQIKKIVLYIISPSPSSFLCFSLSLFFVSYLALNFASQLVALLFHNRAGFVLATRHLECGFCGFPSSQYRDSLRAGRFGDRTLVVREYPHPSSLALGPTLPPVQWTPGFLLDGKTAGVWL
jgi:hypothetical protein